MAIIKGHNANCALIASVIMGLSRFVASEFSGGLLFLLLALFIPPYIWSSFFIRCHLDCLQVYLSLLLSISHFSIHNKRERIDSCSELLGAG